MTETSLRGVIPIAYSTFTKDGDLDDRSFRRQVQTLVDDGCNAIAVFGLASEYYKLTDKEREAMMNIVVNCCDADTSSVINITHHATEVAVKRAIAAERAGADYLMLLPPFFLGPDAEDICEHARRVADAVSIPIVFQYAPDHTGVSLSAERLAQLARDTESITHFKIENVPSGPYITSLLDEADGECSVLVGRAGYQMIEAYDRGAVGVLPGAGYYDIYLEIERRYRTGDRDGAISLHNDLLALLNHTTQNLEMAITYGKRALCDQGIIDSAYCRHPTFQPDRRHDQLFETYYSELRQRVESDT